MTLLITIASSAVIQLPTNPDPPLADLPEIHIAIPPVDKFFNQNETLRADCDKRPGEPGLSLVNDTSVVSYCNDAINEAGNIFKHVGVGESIDLKKIWIIVSL